jgi:hypothetical protein
VAVGVAVAAGVRVAVGVGVASPYSPAVWWACTRAAPSTPPYRAASSMRPGKKKPLPGSPCPRVSGALALGA